jgi:hypothetical protein
MSKLNKFGRIDIKREMSSRHRPKTFLVRSSPKTFLGVPIPVVNGKNGPKINLKAFPFYIIQVTGIGMLIGYFAGPVIYVFVVIPILALNRLIDQIKEKFNIK